MTDEQNAVEMVRMGYEESTRNLNFRVGFATFNGMSDELREAVRAIGPYNGFEPETALRALEGLGDALGWRVSVGREGSPVLYIEARDADRVMAAMRGARADEVDVDGREIRAWWD